jgi:hypothetical protein
VKIVRNKYTQPLFIARRVYEAAGYATTAAENATASAQHDQRNAHAEHSVTMSDLGLLNFSGAHSTWHTMIHVHGPIFI